jgi:hypothetical protein
MVSSMIMIADFGNNCSAPKDRELTTSSKQSNSITGLDAVPSIHRWNT